MEPSVEFIPSGGITSPKGFRAGAACAGIKDEKSDRPDLAILSSGAPCTAAGVFTRNKIIAAPVVLSRRRLQDSRIQAVIANSGCANACTGKAGLADALEMAGLAAGHIGIPPESVAVASTGVIGQKLPMERIRAGIGKIVLAEDGGHDFARAIMTTDTVPKEVAVSAGDFIIGGVAKGSGMIHPDMATLLCFITTDARLEPDFLKLALREAVDVSFNMVSIDGDTSTNDMVLVMASGLGGGEAVKQGGRRAGRFRTALNEVCVHLAKAIARDGEGANRSIEVNVRGAVSIGEARIAARTVVSSPLVKAAVHGSDPNWGRVLAAVGRSGVAVSEDRVDLDIGGVRLLDKGLPLRFDRGEVVKAMSGSEVSINIDLNLGSARATAWGCDLSEEYITINSEYTT